MKKILKGADYNRIEEELTYLIEDLGLKYFPMDCFEVAVLLKIEVRTYSDFCKEDRNFVVSKAKDGFTVRKNGGFVIYYDASVRRDRVLFTIWHEIAHIHLGHFESNISYKQMEEEANHFAAAALAPLAFVHNLSLTSEDLICKMCGVSEKMAGNVIRHYNRAFRYESVKRKILNGRITKLLTFKGGDKAMKTKA